MNLPCQNIPHFVSCLGQTAPADATWLAGAGAIVVLGLLLAVVTCFAKLAIIAGAVRYGIGATKLLSGPVATGFAALLTVVIMWPVFAQCANAFDQAGKAPEMERWSAGAAPLAKFLHANSSAGNLELFASSHEAIATKAGTPAALSGVSASARPIINALCVEAPAFMLTELSEAFQSALLILIPFLVIDLVVMNITLAMGANSLPARSVSLPLKLLVFIMMDGWRLIVQGVVLGYSYS